MASKIYPAFWSQPIRYMRWAAHDKPAIFYSVIVGACAPLSFVVAPPIRRAFGDEPGRPQIPLTYPIPPGPRKPVEGYDD